MILKNILSINELVVEFYTICHHLIKLHDIITSNERHIMYISANCDLMLLGNILLSDVACFNKGVFKLNMRAPSL